MKAVHRGNTYDIKFYYTPVEKATLAWDHENQEPVIRKKFLGNETSCIIEELITDHAGRVCGGTRLIEAVARLHPEERSYNKPLGRLTAFKRATAKLPDRALRKALWGTFLATHRMPIKPLRAGK